MEDLFKWVSVANRYAQIELDRRLASFGINSPQHVLLIKICENPGISQDGIQGMVYLNASNVTRAIAQLEKAGFVERKTGEHDKRVKELYPTAKAENAFQGISEAIAAWRGAVTADLTPEENQQLGRLMKIVGLNAIALVEGGDTGVKESAQ